MCICISKDVGASLALLLCIWLYVRERTLRVIAGYVHINHNKRKLPKIWLECARKNQCTPDVRTVKIMIASRCGTPVR